MKHKFFLILNSFQEFVIYEKVKQIGVTITFVQSQLSHENTNAIK